MATLNSNKTESVEYFRASFRRWCQESGLTQLQIAMHLNVAQSLVNGLISDKSSLTFAKAEQIAAAIGMNLTDMLVQGRTLVRGGPGSPPNINDLSAGDLEAVGNLKKILRQDGQRAADVRDVLRIWSRNI